MSAANNQDWMRQPGFGMNWDLKESLDRTTYIHEIAHWRSKYIGLLYENQQLHNMIEQLLGFSLRPTGEEGDVGNDDDDADDDDSDERSEESEEESNEACPFSSVAYGQGSSPQVSGVSHANFNGHINQPSSTTHFTQVGAKSNIVSRQKPDYYFPTKSADNVSRQNQMEPLSSPTGNSQSPLASNSVSENEDEALMAYLEFAQETEDHRARLRKKNNGNGSWAKRSGEDGVDLDTSESEEFESAFEQLQTEMKELYGSRAEEVHQLETVIQMGFDHHADATRAKMWPAVPMRRM